MLFITIDQFQGDLPACYADGLGEGIHYNNGHQPR